MTFTTPCFVRVEDAAERKKLIEWLDEIGYNVTDLRHGNYVISAGGKVYMAVIVCASKPFIDAGTSVELFRALAAMNDENCLEQWFTDGQNWGLCKDKYWAVQVAKWDVDGNDDMLEMAINSQCRKATAEEIVEYFKKREK